jgi:hypothetical protein
MASPHFQVKAKFVVLLTEKVKWLLGLSREHYQGEKESKQRMR